MKVMTRQQTSFECRRLNFDQTTMFKEKLKNNFNKCEKLEIRKSVLLLSRVVDQVPVLSVVVTPAEAAPDPDPASRGFSQMK